VAPDDESGRREELVVTYDLTCAPGEDPRAKALGIALEQTVELPESCVTTEIRQRVVGRLEGVTPLPEGRFRSVIRFDAELAAGDLPQLLNLLFGNISLQSGIRLVDIGWPQSLLDGMPGPRHGIDGLRRACGVSRRRPLLCAALKPLGLSTTELARICHDLASSGVDLIKDDHGLADQRAAPFSERLAACGAAVRRANARTGRSSAYFPNVTAPAGEMDERIERAEAEGCPGILVSPFLVGLDTVRRRARLGGPIVLAHPSLSGGFFHPDHGIAPEVLLGQIFRMIGCDGVIFPNADGRFPFSESTCAAVRDALRGPLGELAPGFPVPGGGIDITRIDHWKRRYGPDTVFLVGGSLYAQPDLAEACSALAAALEGPAD